MADEKTKVTLEFDIDVRTLEGLGKTLKVTFDDDTVKKFTGAMEGLSKQMSRSVDLTEKIHKKIKRFTREAGEGISALTRKVGELNSVLATTGTTGSSGGGGGGGGGIRPSGGSYIPYRVTSLDQAAFTTLATGGLGAPSAFQQVLWTKGLNALGYAGRKFHYAEAARARAGMSAAAAKAHAARTGIPLAATAAGAVNLGATGMMALGGATVAAGILALGALSWHGWSRGNQLASGYFDYERQRMQSAPFVAPGSLLGESSGYPVGQGLGYGPAQALGSLTQAAMGMYRDFDPGKGNLEQRLMFSAARGYGISPGAFGGFMGAAERTGTKKRYGAARLAARTISVAEENLGLKGQAIVDHFQEMAGFIQQQAAMGQKVDVNSLLAQQAVLKNQDIPGYLTAGIVNNFAASAQSLGMRGMQSALDVRLMRAAGYDGTGGAEGYATAMLNIQHAGRDPELMFKFFNQILGETGTRGTDFGALVVQRAVSQMGGHIGAQEARIISGMDVTQADIARIGNSIGGYDGKGLMAKARRVADKHPFIQELAGLEGREIGIGAEYARNTLDLRSALDHLASAVAQHFIEPINMLTGAINDLAASLHGDEVLPKSSVPPRGGDRKDRRNSQGIYIRDSEDFNLGNPQD